MTCPLPRSMEGRVATRKAGPASSLPRRPSNVNCPSTVRPLRVAAAHGRNRLHQPSVISSSIDLNVSCGKNKASFPATHGASVQPITSGNFLRRTTIMSYPEAAASG